MTKSTPRMEYPIPLQSIPKLNLEVRVGLLGRPLRLKRYYLMIPGTKCSEAISGNDPILIYDLLKLSISHVFSIDCHHLD